MPRVTKDTEKDEKSKKKRTTKKTNVADKAKASEEKKVAKTSTKKKVTKTTTKKATAKKETKKSETTSKKAVSKSTTSKKVSTAKTKEVKKEASTSAKKKASKVATTKSKKTTTSATKKKATTKRSTTKVKKLDSNIVAEYYDLPYRYNETIVKILYQTPTILFVYWDISDNDRENFIKQYGEHFFYNTKPVLKVFNLTKNYEFEIEINDFANSWYIHVDDANCEYKVELDRKTVSYQENLNADYIYVSSSNNIEFPNDHILLDELPDSINFRNVKTNKITSKDIKTLRLIGINKIYNIHNFYKRFYKDDLFEEINSKISLTSSSSSWSN